MPTLSANGIQLSYRRSGRGEPVLLIMGSAAAGHVWDLYQTGALHRAGHETITFDNRGMPPSAVPPGKYTLEDLVADTKGLIEALDLAPCRMVGVSLGALIVQELAAADPHLVRSAVLMAPRARGDVLRRAQSAADLALLESGTRPPPEWQAVSAVQRMLSPRTLNDDEAMTTWLGVFEIAGSREPSGGGQAWVDTDLDRRATLPRITAPCRVIAFADDGVSPPHLAAEVAEGIPDCDLVEIAGCGHLGYLERPEQVNEAMTAFFAEH